MSLRAKQSHFVVMVGDLIRWTYSHPGWELTFGECYRTPEQAAWNAAHGIGIKNSLHIKRLAIDLNLFIVGVYQTDASAYRPLGEFWEGLGGSWGGRFENADPSHFSLADGGYKLHPPKEIKS